MRSSAPPVRAVWSGGLCCRSGLCFLFRGSLVENTMFLRVAIYLSILEEERDEP